MELRTSTSGCGECRGCSGAILVNGKASSSGDVNIFDKKEAGGGIAGENPPKFRLRTGDLSTLNLFGFFPSALG